MYERLYSDLLASFGFTITDIYFSSFVINISERAIFLRFKVSNSASKSESLINITITPRRIIIKGRCLLNTTTKLKDIVEILSEYKPHNYFEL